MSTCKINDFRHSNVVLAGILAIISILFFSAGLNAPFVTTGEPREALVAQSMAIHNDLLQSVRYGQDLATKPPLLHWLMVACSQAFGEVNEISARLPSVVAATVASVAWTIFLIPYLGVSCSLLFFIVLNTSGEWYRHASHARVDMLLACLISLALLTLFKWTQTKESKWFLFSGVLMALAALTKGPIGIALPVAITFAALALWKQLNVKESLMLGGIAVFALLPLLAWYSAEIWIGNSNLIDIVLHENLDRLKGTMSSGVDPHTHGPLYLFGALFIGLLPWSVLAVASLPLLLSKKATLAESQEINSMLQWCSSSVIIALLVFLIPSSKRGVYLLPIYPLAATLLAVVFHKVLELKTSVLRKAATLGVSLLGFAWLVVFLIRLKLFDFGSLLHSEKTLAKYSFYTELFELSWFESSIYSWSLQIIPLAFMAIILFAVKRRFLPPLQGFGIALALTFTLAKISFVTPAAEKLSPKNFILRELHDHRPPEIALRTIRMYAEAFYIRQANPSLSVKDYSDSSKFVLLWKEDEKLLPQPPIYVHRSEEDVKKPGRHLEFAIVE